MTVDLDKLEALAKAATPGPWYPRATDDDHWMNARFVSTKAGAGWQHDNRRLMSPDENVSDEVVAITLLQMPALACHASEQWDETTEYIAALSPDVALALVAEVRELRKALAASRAEEREECARLCDSIAAEWALSVEVEAASRCARGIRARGETGGES